MFLQMMPTNSPMKSFFRWNLGDGSITHFWTDQWLHNSPLCYLFPRAFNLAEIKWSIQDITLTISGTPRGRSRSEVNSLLQALDGISVSRFGADSLKWLGNISDAFSSSEAYLMLSPRQQLLPQQEIDFVWQQSVPKRINVFAMIE